MKKFMMFAFLMVVGTVAFGQRHLDPSHSLNNYEHANKAAYARKNNIHKSPEFQAVDAADSRYYKHPPKRTKAIKQTGLPSGNGSGSHKHPLEL